MKWHLVLLASIKQPKCFSLNHLKKLTQNTPIISSKVTPIWILVLCPHTSNFEDFVCLFLWFFFFCQCFFSNSLQSLFSTCCIWKLYSSVNCIWECFYLIFCGLNNTKFQASNCEEINIFTTLGKHRESFMLHIVKLYLIAHIFSS